MDLNIVNIVLLAVGAWIVIQICLGVMDALVIIKLQNRVNILKQLQETIHQVKIEKNGDVEYWFDQDSDQFLGQGKTLDEVVAVLKLRFPNHIFLLEKQGGIAKQTGWQLMGPDEFKKIVIFEK